MANNSRTGGKHPANLATTPVYVQHSLFPQITDIYWYILSIPLITIYFAILGLYYWAVQFIDGIFIITKVTQNNIGMYIKKVHNNNLDVRFDKAHQNHDRKTIKYYRPQRRTR